ncbi:acyl-CoA thioesterase [Bacillus suaedaesalsae]|uniref:Acyl-CoA thioesterase n=1 Tax=Bacillus suaedaesalsae TaxID=2810349 RepID=A0ABS2DMS1_9BACI|nr:thioesterase family protein [Bacillus suaedaesalsae]MBM6619791.1 acyl-CoA thioesterase [Bacillus suaedaesalsae]
MVKATYIDHFETWQKEFIFSHPIKVRFSETDMFGHVNNTVVFTYLEEARIEFFKSLGLMQYWIEGDSDLIPVVADLQCDYLSQTFFDEKLEVKVKVNKLGSSSVDIHYLVQKQNGKPAFVGRGTIVQISKKTGKPVGWTENWRKSLLTMIGKECVDA